MVIVKSDEDWDVILCSLIENNDIPLKRPYIFTRLQVPADNTFHCLTFLKNLLEMMARDPYPMSKSSHAMSIMTIMSRM
jgi:hypothetical protein